MANLKLQSKMKSTSQTFKATSSGGDFPFCNNSRMISKRLLLDSISSFLNSQKKGWITSVKFIYSEKAIEYCEISVCPGFFESDVWKNLRWWFCKNKLSFSQKLNFKCRCRQWLRNFMTIFHLEEMFISFIQG